MVRTMRPVLRAAAVVGACVLAVAACGGSSTTSAGSGSKTIAIGLLTDQTGPAASAFKTAVQGFEAGVGLAGQEGYHFKTYVVDTGSSPTEAISGAQKLVEQDHVLAVIGVSGLLFAAAPYLTQHGIPVIGDEVDASEWQEPQSTNMFTVGGIDDFTKVSTTTPQFLKLLGATTFGGIGYGISPSSGDAVKGGAIAAKAVGLRDGFVDANFPYGGTNVGPDAIQMKNTGVDGLVAYVYPSTSFSLITALKQEGVNLKAAVLTTGYGGDLLSSGAAAESTATGDYFNVPFEPVEMQTAATKEFQAALAKYASVNQDPTFDEYVGYVSVDALVQGLKAAGGSGASQKQLITALAGIHNYNARGLLGPEKVDLGSKQMPAQQCGWFAKWNGKAFETVPNAEPVCGHLVPGATVSSGS